jgi:hypothetical protein
MRSSTASRTLAQTAKLERAALALALLQHET